MRIKPLPGLWVSIRADPDIRATRLVVEKVPTLPAKSAIRRILGRSILFLIDQIPFPGPLFLRESFPRLIPQLVWPNVSYARPPAIRHYSKRRGFTMSSHGHGSQHAILIRRAGRTDP